jgi:guanylate kinase
MKSTVKTIISFPPKSSLQEKTQMHSWSGKRFYTNQYYGTLKSEIEKIWAEGRNVIFDLDVLGGLNLKKIFGDRALAVFVKPPSIESLRFRLRNRSTETAEKIAMRIAKAQHELSFESQFDAVIVNDILEEAFLNAETKVRTFLEK